MRAVEGFSRLSAADRPAWIIVGAGFTGAVLAERIASGLGDRVLVVERRRHIGGNAYDEVNEHGLLIHRYGPHIFHTNADRIWTYLSQFTEWRPYEHRVLGAIDGRLVPIPFNLDSVHALLPKEAPALERVLVDRYGVGARVPILEMRRSADRQLQGLAELIYEKVFLGYTVKQWGLAPEQLDPGVTARVPVVVSRDDRYFNDRFQAMPRDGYTALFRRLLDHPKIEVALGEGFSPGPSPYPGARVIHTGPIDEYFDFALGPLRYRTIDFEFTTLDVEQYQPVATVNYPNQVAYTRITEQKQITGQRHERTTLVAEYPRDHVPKLTEPYYPIPRAENRILYERYVALARAELGDMVQFAGRLGDYRYYNMDQAVGRALSLFAKLAAKR
jgi:UDP-galactopyranose mutase